MQLKRTVNCGELTGNNVGEEVILNGWIAKNRDHGGVIFLDLRDRYGKTQVTFNPDVDGEMASRAKRLGMEDVIAVKGVVQTRPDGNINTGMPTGEIEVLVSELEILNEAEPLPFLISDRETGSEELRLEYRYLELRTKELQNFMQVRARTYQAVRTLLSDEGFMEFETPVLMKSTPEGARDYLVPSRIHVGKFYALPQSPQTYKQLLMISGYDKYFQIVKCFRDEDLRADRQPEFTQIDIEMSFVDQDDVLALATRLARGVFSEVLGVKLPAVFPILDYKEAMETYGSDKPDTRFEMPLVEFAAYAEKADFGVFKDVLASGGRVKGLILKNAADKISRKVSDGLTEWLKTYYGIKGLAFFKVDGNGLMGGISKFFEEELQQEIINDFTLETNDIMFFVSDSEAKTLQALGALRLELAKRESLIPENEFRPLFVVNFPLLDWDEDSGRYIAMHHPFTSPRPEDVELMTSDPAKVRARAYDLVINGYEVAGGSIRIHTREMQNRMFELIGMDEAEAEARFGFLLKAFRYGAPPHGGIAFGYDRLIMLLAGTDNIRDVIAFPKTTSAASLMDDAPSTVSEDQLKELHIKLIK
ncbi:MAG: aspartate--tRNA ligase [Candidatus Marinimicrobia bacterium]|nr:aspartate--tRNA ligase [Candidatus Neomarinimicrobiota bacterium]MCF7851227.1 aspartate--tRNA ligase [Candidatus Neomarinimicrobiota bacterium]MCF7905391.1 aspartate--tRNA ligase [Candidatus Neomarinimicrobiota bacterium]